MTEEEVIELYKKIRGSKKIFNMLWNTFSLISLDMEKYERQFDSLKTEKEKLIECINQLIFVGEYFNSWIDVWSDYYEAPILDKQLQSVDAKRRELTACIFTNIKKKKVHNLHELLMHKDWDEFKNCIKHCLSIPNLEPKREIEFTNNWDEFFSWELYGNLLKSINAIF